MNNSWVNDYFKDFKKKWFAKKFADELEMSKLLTVDRMHPIPWSRFFIGHVQPPLSLLYLGFSLFILYIFVKNNMTGFVNNVIILSNLIVITPMVLTAPLIAVFFNSVGHDIPLPYPWCSMYVILDTSVKSTAHTTSLYLKLLLVINRLCSVYRPFDTRIWFTKKRSIVYCLVTIMSCIVAGILLNFTYEKIIIKPAFDDLWGKIRNYNACSMDPSLIHGDQSVISTTVVILLLNIVGLGSLLVCDIFFIIKLRQINSRRKNLAEGRTKCEKQTDSRINMVNTISAWVITASIVNEIPSLVNKALSLYGMLNFARHGSEIVDEENDVSMIGLNSEGQTHLIIFYYIDIVILAPLDLIIFVIKSKKTKDAIRSIICRCAKKDRNSNS